MHDRALKYLLAVVRTGSVRAAAEVLNVAASAVSRQIIDLEIEVGQPLLERLPRGVVPTEAGRIMAEHAQREADERALLEDRLRRLKGVEQGTVRLCCGGGFLVDFMEQGLARFAQTYGGVSFKVSLSTTDGILAAIAQGDADIGMAYNPPGHPDVRSVVTARQPLLAVVPQDHPLKGSAGPVPLGTFAAEPAALFPPDHGIRQMLGRVEADNGFRLISRLETTSFELHRRFIAGGLGVGFLPRFVVEEDVKAGAMRLVTLRDPLLAEARTHLLLRAGRRLPEAARRLVNHLAEHMIAFQGLT